MEKHTSTKFGKAIWENQSGEFLWTQRSGVKAMQYDVNDQNTIHANYCH